MQKKIIIIGIVVIIIGIFWPFIVKLPFGRLPGDIIIEKPNFKIYIPITTMILASVLLTLIFWLFRK